MVISNVVYTIWMDRYANITIAALLASEASNLFRQLELIVTQLKNFEAVCIFCRINFAIIFIFCRYFKKDLCVFGTFGLFDKEFSAFIIKIC